MCISYDVENYLSINKWVLFLLKYLIIHQKIDYYLANFLFIMPILVANSGDSVSLVFIVDPTPCPLIFCNILSLILVIIVLA